MNKLSLFLIIASVVVSSHTACMRKRIVKKKKSAVSLRDTFNQCKNDRNKLQKLVEEKKQNKKRLKKQESEIFNAKRDISLLKCCSMLGCLLSCGLALNHYSDIKLLYSSFSPPAV